MITDRLSEILASLLLYAQMATGYAVPAEAPEVVFLPQAELAHKACHMPCPVYGWYSLGHVIYLNARLDPIQDMEARGILLHELVHYLQHFANAFTDDIECRNWGNRERQAYKVQGRWLLENRVTALAYRGAGRAPWTQACRHSAVGQN